MSETRHTFHNDRQLYDKISFGTVTTVVVAEATSDVVPRLESLGSRLLKASFGKS